MPSSGGYTPPGYHIHVPRLVVSAHLHFYRVKMPYFLGRAAKILGTLIELYFHGANACFLKRFNKLTLFRTVQQQLFKWKSRRASAGASASPCGRRVGGATTGRWLHTRAQEVCTIFFFLFGKDLLATWFLITAAIQLQFSSLRAAACSSCSTRSLVLQPVFSCRFKFFLHAFGVPYPCCKQV